jgi:hypothetical protein
VSDFAELEATELAEHVADILFDGSVYNPDCVLCKRAVETGAFAAYGIDPNADDDD